MSQGVMTIIYPVGNVAQAKTLYQKLAGAPPSTDSPYYVGFTVGGQEIGLLPNGHASGLAGPLGYWHVADIRKTLRLLLEAGAKVQQEVKDVGGGKLVASVMDADGNPIGLLQAP